MHQREQHSPLPKTSSRRWPFLIAKAMNRRNKRSRCSPGEQAMRHDCPRGGTILCRQLLLASPRLLGKSRCFCSSRGLYDLAKTGSYDLARLIHNADARVLDRYVQSSKMLHAALLLPMLEAASARPRFTISLKRSTQNLQLSTSMPADYPIY